MPGHGKAVASLVLGIIGVVFWWFGYSAIVSLVLGVIGLFLAASARKEGNTEGVRTAGFVLCIISTVVGGIIFAACVACAGAVGASGGCAALSELANS